jgi:hypothetical protein
MAKRVADLVEEFLPPAFDEVFPGDDLIWEWSIVMTPETGTVIYVSVWAKSALLGQFINNAVIIPVLPEMTAESALDAVRAIRENIDQARSEVLMQSGQAMGNGDVPPDALQLP